MAEITIDRVSDHYKIAKLGKVEKKVDKLLRGIKSIEVRPADCTINYSKDTDDVALAIVTRVLSLIKGCGFLSP